MSRTNIIFIGALVLIGAGVLWYMYSLGGATAPAGTAGAGQVSTGEGVRLNILAAIEALRAIRLDTTILEDPAFLELREVERAVVPEAPLGKANPFVR